jgi:hypothetical protein
LSKFKARIWNLCCLLLGLTVLRWLPIWAQIEALTPLILLRADQSHCHVRVYTSALHDLHGHFQGRMLHLYLDHSLHIDTGPLRGTQSGNELLTVCAACKQIRNPDGSFSSFEVFFGSITKCASAMGSAPPVLNSFTLITSKSSSTEPFCLALSLTGQSPLRLRRGLFKRSSKNSGRPKSLVWRLLGVVADAHIGRGEFLGFFEMAWRAFGWGDKAVALSQF